MTSVRGHSIFLAKVLLCGKNSLWYCQEHASGSCNLQTVLDQNESINYTLVQHQQMWNYRPCTRHPLSEWYWDIFHIICCEKTTRKWDPGNYKSRSKWCLSAANKCKYKGLPIDYSLYILYMHLHVQPMTYPYGAIQGGLNHWWTLAWISDYEQQNISENATTDTDETQKPMPVYASTDLSVQISTIKTST